MALTVPVALGLAVPLKTQAASNVGVIYRYEDGAKQEKENRVGIRSVVIDGKTYFDIHDGSKTGRTDPTNQLAFLQAVVQSGKGMADGSDSVIGQWASLAEQIYGSNSHYAARVNAGGGFKANFTGTSNRERSGYADLAYALAQPTEHTVGSQKNDYTKWTGLAYATNLKDVRQKAADSIADAIHRDIDGSRVLKETDGDNTLSQLSDDTNQDVLYSLVTCVDRAGKTFKYNYNTFGIAFYDFQLSVLAGEGLEYVTKAQKYDSLEQAANNNVSGVTYKTNNGKNPVISYYKNESKQEADIGMEFTQSNSVTTSNTLETGKSYSYSQMIGSETMLSGGIPLLGKVEQTLKMEVTCEQALSTAYSETKEYNETSENKVSSSMLLPAQTAVGMESSKSVTNVQLGYDCPVAVTYKVAIFSLSGVVYDDSAAVHSFHTSGYRQSHFSTIFGSSSAKGGTNAMDNLYNRAVKYTATPNYEQSYGQTVGWTEKRNDGSSPDKLNGLNWGDILNGKINEEEIGTEMADIKVHRVLVNDKGEIQSTFESKNLGEKYPVDYETLVTMSSTYELNGKKYNLYTGEVKNSNGDTVDNEMGHDTSSGRYSKSVQPIGEEEKKSLKASGVTDAEIEAMNSVTFYYTEDTSGSNTAGQNGKSSKAVNHSITQAARAIQKAASNGDATLKDKVSWLATKCPMSVTGGVLSYDAVSMNSNINAIVPLYPLKNIKVTNGIKTLNMISGDTFDLSTVTLNGTNENDVDYYGFDQDKGHWVLTDAEGHELKNSKMASIAKESATDEEVLTAGEQAGTLYLKYIIDEGIYTSLQGATPADNASLDSTARIKVNVTTKPFDGSVQAEGTVTTYVGEEPINLIGNESIKGYALDSTDKKITGAPIVWEARLDEEDGIKLENNQISFTKEGTFQIRATYRGKHSDWITVKALPKKEFTTIKISDDTNPATLESFIFDGKRKIVDLSKLTRKALDQYGGEWKDTSDVAWHIDYIAEEEKKSFSDYLLGNRLPIDGAGTYKITAVSRKYKVTSNVLELEVKPARKIAKLAISDDTNPSTLAGFIYKDKGTPDSIDLSKFTLEATDQYGDTYADTSGVTWNVELNGEKADFAELQYGELPIKKAGSYKIWAKYGDIVSNILQLDVKAERVLKTLSVETDLEKNGIGIGDSYASNLKEDVTVTALDQYGDAYDWTKESYQWITGGRYSQVTGDTLLGLVKGSDTLQLIAGEEEARVESNVVNFTIIAKPYVKELYTGDSAIVREGERYDLSKVNFIAKDQNGDPYELSAKEIDSIEWELTDKGTIDQTQVSFDAKGKSLTVSEGTLEYGETGNVILRGTFTNKNGEKAQAVQFTLSVRQKPVLDKLSLEKKDADTVLKNGENAYIDEYFTVKGLDQYEEDYDLSGVQLTWTSDNEKAFRFNQDKMEAVESGKKANITVNAMNRLQVEVISNALELKVPRVRSLQKITLKEVPEVLAFHSTLDVSTLKVTCYDELDEAYSQEELKAYPAKVVYSLDANETDCKLDTSKNILRTGKKYGYITISAMAVNSSTTNTVQDEDGKNIISSVKIWVGPKVESLKATEKMIATAGANTVTLEGKCLEDNMKIGLFDASGKLVCEKVTSGNKTKQSVTLDIPSNIGGQSDITYTVKYAITGTYMDEPTGKIVVSNKIPATGVKLNKNTLILAPGKSERLLAYLSQDNSTDKLNWKSFQTAVASVDQNGNVRAVAPGKCVITVITESGKTASCNVLVGLRKGDVITSGIYRYKVTKAMVDGSGELEVLGFVKGRSAKKVAIPKKVTWNTIKYNVTSVGTRAFTKNKKIRSIVIPDSVSTIRHKAFYACPNVKKLTIGKNVSYMGAHAFCLNKKLEKIVFKGTKLKKLRDPHVFIEVNHAKVYVPKRKYKAYKKKLSNYGLGKCKFVKK